MVFYDWLKNICESKGLKITPTVLHCGGTKGMIGGWQKGGCPNSDIIVKLAEYLNVSTDYLLLGEKADINNIEQSLLDNYRNLSEENQDIILSNMDILLKSQNIELPCCSETTSAGMGILLSDYSKWELKTFAKTKISQKADFVLIVNGDSMEPEFQNKDYVLIRSQPVVDIGQIGIFYMDGKGYIKKYGGDTLISLNPKYQPFSTNYEDFRCYGLVLGVAQLIN